MANQDLVEFIPAIAERGRPEHDRSFAGSLNESFLLVTAWSGGTTASRSAPGSCARRELWVRARDLRARGHRRLRAHSTAANPPAGPADGNRVSRPPGTPHQRPRRREAAP